MGAASVDRGSLHDCRVPGPSLDFGPLDTIQDSHWHLRRELKFYPKLQADAQELIRQQQSKFWPLTFTHGDLSSLNILVREDDIVNPQNLLWVHEIDKFLEPMPEELAIERLRQKWVGDVQGRPQSYIV
ncbi:hypothetical protein BO82DRAFT_374011 [Aspergillus uvarum CBS 121591]|uniref:Aminoglycoside phosphotransferase domain-containing protein n=1 Tax=Aspergillus uvarum CBS 121591 TaxID=1448315 RepID=A0A319CBA9_9EURO|nr:hypothetical protein BO82DRAFT_374011 [Aspergillus uvarum CBS 121591]PYH82504.1 hypothetical protein BO82DRAFT_374011 [Aspergillus uvarum CBS 121591]